MMEKWQLKKRELIFRFPFFFTGFYQSALLNWVQTFSSLREPVATEK
jgi:hypothetical protein